jgi:NADPH:quinone reductase
MKAIGIKAFGGPEVLEVVDLPEPEPGPGEVRIRAHAVAVNPTDLTFRSGGRAAQLAGRPTPYVPGVDLAGVIDKLGTGIGDRLAVGEAVVAFVVPFGPRGGSYAEQVVVPASSVVAAPSGASFPAASTLLLNATTARLALDALALTAGQVVAVVGGAGAVGGYAIQLAKADGLIVITDASPDDLDTVRAFGADIVVDRGDDVTAAITKAIPAGVPGLIDTVALDARILPAVADGGAVATLRGWSGPAERRIVVHPIGSYGAASDTALLDRMRTAAEAGVVTLRVAEVLPAVQAADAHRRLAAGGVRGRLVLDFS